jgi:hypothetical protein
MMRLHVVQGSHVFVAADLINHLKSNSVMRLATATVEAGYSYC